MKMIKFTIRVIKRSVVCFQSLYSTKDVVNLIRELMINTLSKCSKTIQTYL